MHCALYVCESKHCSVLNMFQSDSNFLKNYWFSWQNSHRQNYMYVSHRSLILADLSKCDGLASCPGGNSEYSYVLHANKTRLSSSQLGHLGLWLIYAFTFFTFPSVPIPNTLPPPSPAPPQGMCHFFRKSCQYTTVGPGIQTNAPQWDLTHSPLNRP